MSDFDLKLDGSRPRSAVPALQTQPPAAEFRVCVIVPARNEERNLATCLTSLIEQSGPEWQLGKDWRLIVVDDHSTDRTHSIAQEFAAEQPGMEVLQAPALDGPGAGGATGKNAALAFASAQPAARNADWLLMTDADTVHEPGSVHGAVVEAEHNGLLLLSYSPRQITTGLVQRAFMPLVFSDLAVTFPSRSVADPKSPVAAANGQFLLVRRDAYDQAGGHAAVQDKVLEDVELARRIKRLGSIRLRYAPERVATRMYWTTGELIEGWTKNLALLFRSPLLLAFNRLCEFLLLFALPFLPLFFPFLSPLRWLLVAIVWVRVNFRLFNRLLKSGAPLLDCLLATLALPLYAAVLVRSTIQVRLLRQVTWKGRRYSTAQGR